MSSDVLKAPFPWFGGKSRVAHLVWQRFGNTPNYFEPFAGSLAVLPSRPGGAAKNETVNDKDAYLANFWRALQADPDSLAEYADWPVNETDLHARHRWLVAQSDFRERMLTDPDYFDVRIAGWWVWGLSLWIGSGWCVHPEWTGRSGCYRAERGVHAKRPQLKKGNNGVHRAAYADDLWKPRPRLQPQGITRQLPDISGDGGASGRGVHSQYAANLHHYFQTLAARLRRVRVCCGEWNRVLGPSPTTKIGLTAVLLDPPYDLRSVRGRDTGSDGAAPTDKLYSHHDNDLSKEVSRSRSSTATILICELPFVDTKGNMSFPAIGSVFTGRLTAGMVTKLPTPEETKTQDVSGSGFLPIAKGWVVRRILARTAGAPSGHMRVKRKECHYA